MRLPRTSIEQWAVLAAVIDEGSFARAAEKLHKSQSAVSYALAQLSESLGVPILEPQGRRTVLTAHGETLLKRARRVLAEMHTLEDVARSLGQGIEPELRLVVDAAFPQTRLLDVLAALKSSCPSTELELQEAVLSGADEAITQGLADVAITSRVPTGFLGDRLLEVEFVAVAHPAHPLHALGRPITPEDLQRHTQAVVRDSGSVAPRDEGWLGSPQRWTMSSLEAACSAVVAGLAYAWLPEHIVARERGQGRLAPLPLVSGAVRSVALYAVLVKPDSAGPAARRAMELLRA